MIMDPDRVRRVSTHAARTFDWNAYGVTPPATDEEGGRDWRDGLADHITAQLFSTDNQTNNGNRS